MRNDKTIEKLMKSIENNAKEFNEFVESIGNQCAYTDRMIEIVIELATDLKTLYEGNFKEVK